MALLATMKLLALLACAQSSFTYPYRSMPLAEAKKRMPGLYMIQPSSHYSLKRCDSIYLPKTFGALSAGKYVSRLHYAANGETFAIDVIEAVSLPGVTPGRRMDYLMGQGYYSDYKRPGVAIQYGRRGRYDVAFVFDHVPKSIAVGFFRINR